MAFTKITDAEKNAYGVTLLPNVPTISATELKQKFEEKSDDLIIPRYNELIDELEGSTASASMGAKIGGVDTTVQGAIDNLNTNKMTRSVYDSDNDGKVDQAEVADEATTLTDLTASVTELNYSEGVTGNIQTQLNSKVGTDTAVTHTASTAVGAANKGVYVDSDGTAKAMTYEVNKSVPSDAKFTDTTYENRPASSGGDAVSLVTTGEKYDWNNKIDDAYKKIKVGANTLTASGADQVELVSGDNVTISADPSTKKITVSATGGGGGGGGGGDMLKSVYDTDNDGVVNSADTLAGLTASVTELNYSDGVTSNIQTQLDSKTTESDIENAVGWTGKNKLVNTATTATVKEVTFTVNSDKSVTMDGTCTDPYSIAAEFVLNAGLELELGEYILSTGITQASNPNNDFYIAIYGKVGTSSTFIDKVYYGEKTIDLNEYSEYNYTSYPVEICVLPGRTVDDVTLYPMLRKATDSDSTYEPAHKSVKDTFDDYYTKAEIDEKDKVTVKYSGTKTFSELTSSLLVAANENKFFLLTNSGYITDENKNMWSDAYISGDHIMKDSHIAVIAHEVTAYKPYGFVFDDFGGFVEVDEWTAAVTQSGTTVTFDNLNPAYGYKLFWDSASATGDLSVPRPVNINQTSGTNTGTIKLTYTIKGGTSGSSQFKLRILK